MIGALADDFTGAAEIAGVSLRFGLRAAVTTQAAVPARADLAVIDTETRSLDAAAAASVVSGILRRVSSERVEWVFKKVDSVLRGPVVPEIAAVLSEGRFTRALLVPANPALGRIIRDGRYLVDGRGIDQSEFAQDPERPLRSGSVADMLGSPAVLPIAIRRPGAALPEGGIIIGEAESDDHLAAWADALDERTLAAGAAAFFDAVLRQRLGRPTAAQRDSQRTACVPALAVSGSASHAAREFAAACERRGRIVLRIPAPAEGSATGGEIARWAQSAADGLERDGWVLLTLAAAPQLAPKIAGAAHALLVRAAKAAVDRTMVRTLYVDGGATAAALTRLLGWSCFDATAEHAPGVVALRPHAPGPISLVVKPGSYRWPAHLFE